MCPVRPAADTAAASGAPAMPPPMPAWTTGTSSFSRSAMSIPRFCVTSGRCRPPNPSRPRGRRAGGVATTAAAQRGPDRVVASFDHVRRSVAQIGDTDAGEAGVASTAVPCAVAPATGCGPEGPRSSSGSCRQKGLVTRRWLGQLQPDDGDGCRPGSPRARQQ